MALCLHPQSYSGLAQPQIKQENIPIKHLQKKYLAGGGRDGGKSQCPLKIQGKKYSVV